MTTPDIEAAKARLMRIKHGEPKRICHTPFGPFELFEHTGWFNNRSIFMSDGFDDGERQAREWYKSRVDALYENP